MHKCMKNNEIHNYGILKKTSYPLNVTVFSIKKFTFAYQLHIKTFKLLPISILKMPINGKIFFWLTCILIVFVRLRLVDIAMERDEGEYAYAAWQILEGKLPYSDFYNMKFPGVYYMYALVFRVAGLSMVAIRVWVLIMNLLSAFFIYKIAETRLIYKHPMPNDDTKWIAAGLFLLLCISFGAQGCISNCEHFVVFFGMMGLWLLTERQFFLSGLAIGLSVMMKQQGFGIGIFGGVTLLYEFYHTDNKLLIIKQLFFYCLGIILPFCTLVAYVWQHNIFDKFYFYAIEYAAAYASILQPTFKEIYHIVNVFIDSPILWILFFVGLSKIIKDFAKEKSFFTEGGGLLLLWLMSFIAVSAGWYYRPHYFQLMFPAVALVVAHSLQKGNWRILKYTLQRYHLLAIIFFTTIVAQPCYFFLYEKEHIVRKMYPHEFFNDIKRFGGFLNKKLPENERIGLYSSDPQLWFYAQRRGASGFLYAFPLTEIQPYAQMMTDTYIQETEKANPEWLLYCTIAKGEDNQKTMLQIDNWFDTYAKNYDVKGILYKVKKGYADWVWETSAVDTSRERLMIVYKRKGI